MSNIYKFIKNNIFLSIVLISYAIITIVNPNLGFQSVKNSSYYIKEMLMIMPVIFILTALLDTWIPKETIIKYLGSMSKSKGIILSFVLGSISAGPIYAAFPFCIMLHKKGASIRNIVIILSSWAVIKIPMLLNEAKFLGMKFMLIRWILTIIAIIIFSWITSKIVKDNDLPAVNLSNKISGVTINRNACMGCTLCTKKYPEIFTMHNKKASVNTYTDLDHNKLDDAINSCPVKAIEFNE